MKRTNILIIGFAVGFAMIGVRQADAQLWLEFAHTDEPHQGRSSEEPMVFPELFADEGLDIEVPVVIVLMEFQDVTHDPQYRASDYVEHFFSEGLAKASVLENYLQTSNGRITLVPVNENFGPNDGVIGWEKMPYNIADKSGSEHRGDAVLLADDYMDFAQFDADFDGFIKPHELILFLVKPGTGGGVTEGTTPEFIPVDGVIAKLSVGALGESREAVVFAHETGHPYFGHGDLYRKCAENWVVGEGYICEISSDDCDFPDNESCECPDALNPQPAISTVGDTSALPITFVPECGEVEDSRYPTAWYEVYGNGNSFTATTCTGATSVDTRLSVFCDGCDELTCIDGNDDDAACGFSSSYSTVSWCTEPEASYLIAVYTLVGDMGGFGLTVTDSGDACESNNGCGIAAAKSRHWYPFKTNWMSIMGSGCDADGSLCFDQTGDIVELDPWAKIHLGFTKPKVITHDGTYQVYATEPIRSLAEQGAEPEAFIIYDPLRPPADRYGEYFIIENRNDLAMPAQGLGIWLINENDWYPPYPETYSNVRHVVRLLARGGNDPPANALLWSGHYDFTAVSEPRKSTWSDGTPSFISVYNISFSGDVMTFSVNMPPIYLDIDHLGLNLGTATLPFRFLEDAVDSIAEPPRSIRIAGGNYPEILTITTPCTIAHWKDGSAVVGE